MGIFEKLFGTQRQKKPTFEHVKDSDFFYFFLYREGAAYTFKRRKAHFQMPIRNALKMRILEVFSILLCVFSKILRLGVIFFLWDILKL